ncbi:MAG: O-linked N-acetylglucosamine transferase, SPINDLY family protein [Phycisphaerales bacterium]
MSTPASTLQLALDHFQAQRFAQAEPLLRRHLQKNPRDGMALRALGSLLTQTDRLEQAIFTLEQAVRLTPEDAELRRQLVDVYAESTLSAKGLPHAEKAVALDPSHAGSHIALGKLVESTAAYDRAEECYRRAIALNPAEAMAHCHLADLHLRTGDPEAAFQRAKETARHSQNFLHQGTAASFSLYSSEPTPAESLAEHAEAVRRMDLVPKPPLAPLRSLNISRDPERVLRVAWLSPDFIDHSVSYFAEPLIRGLDRSRYELVCLFPSRRVDAVTRRLRPLFSVWHDLPEPNESLVIRLLREARVDIAIDLGGYTNSSILWCLRQRVCPVQVSYLGYAGTTAMPSIDYRIVDSKTDPAPAADALAVESLVRLDPSFLCYQPATDIPPVAPLPASDPAAPITFGSFNNIGKLSRDARALFAAVLQANPTARLMLKDGVLAVDDARRRIGTAFKDLGIDPARITLIDRTPTRNDHLATYHKVDIGLDPTPYNGTTTTCEALLMGVPVVTLEGATHAARVGSSLMQSVGLPGLIAHSSQEYVSTATNLAADRAALATLRAGMRPRLLTSPLCDQPAAVARFDAALRTMWRSWCAQS